MCTCWYLNDLLIGLTAFSCYRFPCVSLVTNPNSSPCSLIPFTNIFLFWNNNSSFFSSEPHIGICNISVWCIVTIYNSWYLNHISGQLYYSLLMTFHLPNYTFATSVRGSFPVQFGWSFILIYLIRSISFFSNLNIFPLLCNIKYVYSYAS